MNAVQATSNLRRWVRFPRIVLLGALALATLLGGLTDPAPVAAGNEVASFSVMATNLTQ